MDLWAKLYRHYLNNPGVPFGESGQIAAGLALLVFLAAFAMSKFLPLRHDAKEIRPADYGQLSKTPGERP